MRPKETEMKILKGEKWKVATRNAPDLDIEVLEEVLTHEDDFFKVKIIAGERHKLSGDIEGPGEEVLLRTSLTTWRKQLKA